MFDQLQENLSRTIKSLRGLGKIRESNIAQALTEVRTSLLEADVQYRVVQSLVDSVRERALGQAVLDQVHPGQQFVKILHDELVRILGNESAEIPQISGRPLKIVLTGLQGSGKTTTVAKLALHLRNERSFKPLMVAADKARPAASEQLMQLGKESHVPVFSISDPIPEKVCKAALKAVSDQEVAADCLIFDTAGRLAVDAPLMAELSAIVKVVDPDLILYVLDAMAGQDALQSAKTFIEKIGFHGVIVTKMDGDARGGSALSVSSTLGTPIYFLGTGEKADALEPFHPARMASRILGMGDVLTLVEKAQKVVDQKSQERLRKRIKKNQFNIEDFADQLRSIQKMGSLESIMGMIPGGAQMKGALQSGVPQQEMKRTQAIINSMNVHEKDNYQILNGSRRKRIAMGSGTTVTDVNRFIKQFTQARKMMSRVGKMGMKGLRGGGFF